MLYFFFFNHPLRKCVRDLSGWSVWCVINSWQQNMHVAIVKSPWIGFGLNLWPQRIESIGNRAFFHFLPLIICSQELCALAKSLAPSEIGSTCVVPLWAESKPGQYLALQIYVGKATRIALISRFSLVATRNCQSFEVISLPSRLLQWKLSLRPNSAIHANT